MRASGLHEGLKALVLENFEWAAALCTPFDAFDSAHSSDININSRMKDAREDLLRLLLRELSDRICHLALADTLERSGDRPRLRILRQHLTPILILDVADHLDHILPPTSLRVSLKVAGGFVADETTKFLTAFVVEALEDVRTASLLVRDLGDGMEKGVAGCTPIPTEAG